MDEQVIDASVVIKWLVKSEPFRNTARLLLRDAHVNDIQFIGPPLLEYEVESYLQRLLYHGRVELDVADASLRFFYSLNIKIYEHPELMQHARQIARQFGQERVYDATYAALAELRGCDFWTADRHFYEAVRDDLAFVRYLPDYPG